MSNADNIITSNTSTVIWWNYLNSTNSEDCEFRHSVNSTVAGWMEPSGYFHANVLVSKYGVIVGEDSPLWIVENSIDGDLISFRKLGYEKLLIKADGAILFKDEAKIQTENQEIITENNGPIGNISSFYKQGQKKLSVAFDGSLIFWDTSELLCVSQPLMIKNTSPQGNIAIFKSDTNDRLIIDENGNLIFKQNFSLYLEDTPVFSIFDYNNDKQVFIGKHGGSFSVVDVRIGGLLSLYPQDNGGALSFNKGALDLAIKGEVGNPTKKELLLFTDDALTPNFKLTGQHTITWRIRNNPPNNVAEGDMWLEYSDALYLMVWYNGQAHNLKFRI